MKRILGLTTILAAALVMAGTSFAASPQPRDFDFISACDPCAPIAPCEPCVPACNPCLTNACDPCEPVCVLEDISCDVSCNPCAPTCSEVDPNPCNPCAPTCGEVLPRGKAKKLAVYGAAAGLVGNFDGGYFSNRNDSKLGFQMAGGVKATLGIQRGFHAVEVNYTGIYNSLSTSWYGLDTVAANPFQRINVSNDFHSGDVNFVLSLVRFPHLKIFAGAGYTNFKIGIDRHNNIGAFEGSDSITNEMIGFQVGSKWSRSRGAFGIDTYGKIGIYANAVTVDIGAPIPANFDYGNCRGAWMSSGGVNFTYKLSRCMSSFIGYDVTMAEGVERGGFVVADIIGAAAVVPHKRTLATDRMLLQCVTIGLKCNY